MPARETHTFYATESAGGLTVYVASDSTVWVVQSPDMRPGELYQRMSIAEVPYDAKLLNPSVLSYEEQQLFATTALVIESNEVEVMERD